MRDAKTLTFYLEEPMRKRAEAGQINIIDRISSAFEGRGFRSLFKANTDLEVLESVQNPGYSMFHMEHPFHARALTLRKAYFYPFWRIETSAKRWEWKVARARFRVSNIDPEVANKFANAWRKRLYGNRSVRNDNGDYIYAPLQGRLLNKRSFQSMSPIDMLKTTLAAAPDQIVKTTLHPGEYYSKDEIKTLEALVIEKPRLQLSNFSGEALLKGCDHVVTQNSSVAMEGFFHHKSAVIFAKTDFHHIASNVMNLGVSQAFSEVNKKRQPFDQFLYWFLQLRSINAGRNNAEEKILETVQKHGWKI